MITKEYILACIAKCRKSYDRYLIPHTDAEQEIYKKAFNKGMIAAFKIVLPVISDDELWHDDWM